MVHRSTHFSKMMLWGCSRWSRVSLSYDEGVRYGWVDSVSGFLGCLPGMENYISFEFKPETSFPRMWTQYSLSSWWLSQRSTHKHYLECWCQDTGHPRDSSKASFDLFLANPLDRTVGVPCLGVKKAFVAFSLRVNNAGSDAQTIVKGIEHAVLVWIGCLFLGPKRSAQNQAVLLCSWSPSPGGLIDWGGVHPNVVVALARTNVTETSEVGIQNPQFGMPQ